MVKSSEFAKLKKVFIEARTVFRAAKLALKEDPENAKCKMDVKTTKKAWATAKKAKENFKENSKRKRNQDGGSPSKKMKPDLRNLEKYKPETYKITTPSVTVCVSNVPETTTAENMKRYFGACGGVDRFHFPRNQVTDKFVQFLFVKFWTKIGAKRAVEMSGQKGYTIYYADGGEEGKWNWNNLPKSVCFKFLKGRCMKGSNCQFVHNRGECFDFANGNCAKANTCKFKHVDIAVKDRFKKSNVCNDFRKNRCDRGHYCKFKHD